jgi:predicted RNA binding protein YcfA (HicA-like mRNA interferase family)
MSKHEKLLKRLLSKPKDLEWSEAVSILESIGFETICGDGSRRKFKHKATNVIIIMHKQHPGNIIKMYAIEQIIDSLKEGSFLGEQRV